MTFARRLTQFRDAKQWTTPALTEYLSAYVEQPVSRRTVENWLQGRKEPHPLWRGKIERAITE